MTLQRTGGSEFNFVAEFFIDWRLVSDYHTTSAKWRAAFCWLIPGHGCLLLGPLYSAFACHARQNNDEQYSSMRVGLTDHELVVHTGRHGSGCGCQCEEIGAKTLVVPFEQITDVRVEMPAGGCMPPNVVAKVIVATASQRLSSVMTIEGLLDSHHFRTALLSARAGEALPPFPSSDAGKMYQFNSLPRAVEVATELAAVALLAGAQTPM